MKRNPKNKGKRTPKRRYLHVWESCIGGWDGVNPETEYGLYMVEGVKGPDGFPRLLTAQEVLEGMAWRGGWVF